MRTDLLVAFRRLRQSPGYTVFAVVTLALAIGVTTAVYSLVKTGLQPDLGLKRTDRLMVVASEVTSVARGATLLSWLDFQDLVSESRAFERVVAWSPFTNSLFVDGASEFVRGEFVSGTYFDTIDVRAIRGRMLDAGDEQSSDTPVAVISATLWRTRFRYDDGVIGKAIKIGGRPFQIAGVAPESFHGLDRPQGFGRAEVWLPLSAARLLAQRYDRQDPNRRDHQWLKVAAQLTPNATKETAVTEVAAFGQRLDIAAPLPLTTLYGGGTTSTPRRWTARGVDEPLDFSEAKDVMRIVLLLPSLVLLVACTNLANFSLSRGMARQNEMAVRQAVGASRWQLIRGQIVEYALIAIAGGLGGLIVADRLLALVAALTRQIGGEMPQFRLNPSINADVLLAVAAAAVLSVLVAGLVPALQLTRRNLARSMADNQALASLPRWRGRGNLIALQVSVTVALLLVSALCVRQLPKLRVEANTGTELERVAVVTVPFSMQSMPEARATRVAADALTEIARLPGAERVSVSSDRRYTLNAEIAPAGHELRTGDTRQPGTEVLAVTPDYFSTFGMHLIHGRSVAMTDVDGSARVALISQSQARRLFGTDLVVGRQVSIRILGTRPVVDMTIVGVVSDTRTERGRLEDFLYLPITQQLESTGTLEFQARAADSMDPAALARAMRDILRRVEPEVAVSFVGRADAQTFGQATGLKVFAICFGALAFLALGFAMSGLYGVLAHVVARRTRELGVRSALGADPGRLVSMIFKEGGRPVLEGIVIGFGIAAGARLGMQPWFTDPVTAVDPVALVIALVPLLIAAALACYIPARRAARVDPNVALREL